MPRYTANYEEAQHIAKLAHEMPFGGVVRVYLKRGQEGITAVMTGANMGNNGGIPFGYTGAGRPGPWQYYGEATLLTIDGRRHIVDFLDIERMEAAPAESTAFEKAGLIEIVDWPS